MRHVTGPLTFLLAIGLSAQAPQSRHWVQGKLALVVPDQCNCIKDLAEFGLGTGSWLTPRWGAEVDFLEGRLDSKHSDAQADEKLLQGSVLFGLNPGGRRWFPYLRAGIGAARVGSPYSLAAAPTTRFSFHEGIGIQGFLGPHLLTSLEARAVTIETQVVRTEKQALLGIGFRWGAPGAGPAAPVVDSEPVPAMVPSASAPVTPTPAVAAPAAVPKPPQAAPEPASIPAPATAPRPEPAPPAPTLRIVLDDALLHFDNDQATLSAAGIAAVRRVGRELAGYSGSYALTITGHTSRLGGRAHNLELSRRRAQAVAKVLAETGIAPERMTCIGAGPDQPIADNRTPEGQARNRRVEIGLKADRAEVRHSEAR